MALLKITSCTKNDNHDIITIVNHNHNFIIIFLLFLRAPCKSFHQKILSKKSIMSQIFFVKNRPMFVQFWENFCPIMGKFLSNFGKSFDQFWQNFYQKVIYQKKMKIFLSI